MNANNHIKAIIGLGNPGAKYDHTYHNIGAWSLPFFTDITTYQPKSFMNESGLDLAPWMKMNNIAASQIIVVHDDSDLPIGAYKLASSGSSAGHNGIQSVIEQLGTPDFLRLRIGIRDPHEPVRKKALDFVLNRFSQEQEAMFKAVLQAALLEIKKLL